MFRKISLMAPLSLCVVLGQVSITKADRLILRTSGQIVGLGEGNLDAKKETVLFKKCKEAEAEPFSLRDYHFQTGKDCGPPVWGFHSINIDGTVMSANAEKCSSGQPCLRYTVKSARAIEKLFVDAKEGDKIELVVSKVNETPSVQYKNIDLILRLVEAKGNVRQTLTYHKVSASDEFLSKAVAKQ